MALKDDYKFRKFLETQTNPYKIVLDVARSAKKLAMEYEDIILHSEAITHELQGTKPILKKMDRWESEATEIRDMFCSIEDTEICEAVYDSFYASKEAHNLKYIYNSITDMYRQARVRILTKMLWYSLCKF